MKDGRITDAEVLEAVQRVLSGDREAFRVIVTRYETVCFRVATNYIPDPREVPDAVQEIFLRTYRSLSSYRIDRPFTPWFLSITFNFLKTRGKRLARLPVPREDFSMFPAADAGPETSFLMEHAARRIRESVTRLPAQLREAVILYYMEELSIEEASSILSISQENLKSRLFRARKKLRGMLENMQQEP